MAQELQLIKQSNGIPIPATPVSSDFLQSNCKLGAVLVAKFTKVSNPAFHRRFFALLNLGFEYWEPAGGAISSNERKLMTGNVLAWKKRRSGPGCWKNTSRTWRKILSTNGRH